MKNIVLIFTVLIVALNTYAQTDTPFDKAAFKDEKDGLKEAQKHLKMGDGYFFAVPFSDYKKAFESYENAYKFNPNNALLNFKMGICLINTNFRTRSLDYFEKAYKLNGSVSADIQYYLGQSNQLNSKWDEAMNHYQQYKKNSYSNKEANPELVSTVDKKVKECESGKALSKKPIRVFIDNLGGNINTEYPEYSMIMNADGSEIYFTARRNTTFGGGQDEFSGGYYEDIYSAKKEGKSWTTSKNVGEPINTKGHDATVALSPDGQKMLVYIDDKGDGNIYESIRTGETWSKPKKMDKIICSSYHESSAWYSSDGKKLYFISNRPKDGSNKGAPGDRDIYSVTWNAETAKWENLVRLPDNINSNYDEDGIFVHPDGKTFYFFSKGHNSIGGYDIFYTKIDDKGNFSNPVNIGVPVNTPDDDIFFTVTASGRYGYMTSFRADGFGEKDLYKITFLGEPKLPLLNTEEHLLAGLDIIKQEKTIEPIVKNDRGELALLKGTIYDAKTKIPLYAKIELYDNETGQLLAEFESDKENGRYMLSLPAGKNYGIAVKADGYLFHSENFDIPKGSDYIEVKKDVYMKKMEVGESIVLKNIFFDLDKYSLRPESETEIKRLTKLMNDNPKLKIEISGHTDSRGTVARNKELSLNRAKTVVDYLIKEGISKDRLEYAGYASEKPVYTDAQIAAMKTNKEREAAHQENRRTEFKILAK